VLTTFLSYGDVDSRRQGEIISGLGNKQEASSSFTDFEAMAKALFKQMREAESVALVTSK